LSEREVTLHQHLQGLKEQIVKEEQKKGDIESELDKVSQCIDDFCKQIVTSPDKLRARLHKLQQDVEETKAGTQDSDTLKRMWESLATRAQHIPNVLRGLNEDMEILIMKTNKASDLHTHFTEAIEEQISRQKQTLREVSAKIQNLLRHLKYVEKEAQQVAYDDQDLLFSQLRSDLERDVHQLQTQVQSIEFANEHFVQQSETITTTLENKRFEHEETCFELKRITANLESAVQHFLENCNLTIER
jgi:chromosome segregation ATPase